MHCSSVATSGQNLSTLRFVRPQKPISTVSGPVIAVRNGPLPHNFPKSQSKDSGFIGISVSRGSSRARNTAPARATSISQPSPAPQDPHSSSSTAVSDTWLGALFLRLLPGFLFYAPSFLMPIVTAAAAVGAIYGPALLTASATLPVIRSVGPLAGVLTILGTQQPWATLSSMALSLLTAWYAFGVMPVLDWVLGRELRNPTNEEAQTAANDGLYRAVLFAYVAMHLGTLTLVQHVLCTHAMKIWVFLGVAISCGVANGISFTVAHELLHGHTRAERAAANLLLAPLAYMHWSKSHLMHHVKVATYEDPSSARKGESLYSFVPRSIWGNIVDGFGAEDIRRRAKGIPFWDYRNKALLWVAAPLALAALSTAMYGLPGLTFFLVQAGVGILMLEVVNYIEHYGLQRTKLPSGRYERVEPRHSWNATTIYTNSATFRLQRHSDHHAHESTPYQLLQDIPQAPQLPAGYPAMMLLSTLPPLYFKVMNPLVEAQAANAEALSAAVVADRSWKCVNEGFRWSTDHRNMPMWMTEGGLMNNTLLL